MRAIHAIHEYFERRKQGLKEDVLAARPPGPTAIRSLALISWPCPRLVYLGFIRPDYLTREAMNVHYKRTRALQWIHSFNASLQIKEALWFYGHCRELLEMCIRIVGFADTDASLPKLLNGPSARSHLSLLSIYSAIIELLRSHYIETDEKHLWQSRKVASVITRQVAGFP